MAIKKLLKGFTFIELILYITLVTIIVSALIPFAWSIIGTSAKSSINQDINSQARIISERIKYEIRNANSINSVSPTTLDLNTPTNASTQISYDAVNKTISIRYGASGTPITLNATTTAISSFAFADARSPDFKAQNIQFSFTIDDKLNSSRQDYSVPPLTMQGTAGVRTPLVVTATSIPTATTVPPTATPVPPTNTPIPPTPTLASNTITFSVIEDTYVDSIDTTRNFGREVAMSVDLSTGAAGDPTMVSYIKFNLAPLAGRTITNAILQITAADNGTAHQINIDQVSDTTWGEYTVTHATKPAMGAALGSFATFGVGVTQQLNVTSYIVPKAGQLASFGIDPTGSDGVWLVTKENPNGQHAKLIITYLGTPIPALTPLPTLTPTPPPTSTPVPTSIPTYTITGTVYIDTNSNGVQDAGEVGYNAATVTRTTGVTTTTNTSGVYTFSGVQAGTYTITLTVPAGYSATTTNPVSVSVTTNTTRNFGIALTPTNTPVPPTLTPTPTPPWPQRKKITIQRARIPGVTSLSNFPVLVRITGDTDIGSRSTNGTDIKFTSSDGVTKLKHEIESYTETSGAATLVAWVLVPTVNGASAASNTDIYMYYGNTSGVDQQATCTSATTPTNCVWDANYKAVWHLKDSGTTTVDDITANNKNGSKLTATEPNPSTGLMSGAQAFDGSNDRVVVSSPNLPTGDFTYSAWVNLTSTTNEQIFMAADAAQDIEIGIAVISGKLDVIVSGTGSDVTSSASITTGGWRHIAVTRSGSTIYAYINGVQDTNTGSDSDTLQFNGCQLLIGTYNSSYTSSCTSSLTNFLNGSIDEARISNVARSSSWITSEYNNQSSPSTFYTLGAAEQL